MDFNKYFREEEYSDEGIDSLDSLEEFDDLFIDSSNEA